LVKDAVKRKSDGLGIAEDGSKTIFDLLLEPNSAKGGNELEMHELIDEAFMFILGGTDPIGFTLAAATYYILTSPDVLMKLMTELQEAKSSIEGEYDWKHVQKLPYLVSISICFSSLHAPYRLLY
jgi:cytochrome P450